MDEDRGADSIEDRYPRVVYFLVCNSHFAYVSLLPSSLQAFRFLACAYDVMRYDDFSFLGVCATPKILWYKFDVIRIRIHYT